VVYENEKKEEHEKLEDARLEEKQIEVIQCPSERGISPKPSDIGN